MSQVKLNEAQNAIPNFNMSKENKSVDYKETPKQMIDNFVKHCGTIPNKCLPSLAREMFELVKAFNVTYQKNIHIGVLRDPIYVLDSEYSLFYEYTTISKDIDENGEFKKTTKYIEIAKVLRDRYFEGDEYLVTTGKVDWLCFKRNMRVNHKITFKAFSMKDVVRIVRMLNYYWKDYEYKGM